MVINMNTTFEHMKKRKAAVCAVMYLLGEENNKVKKKKHNRWVRFGREQIMKNNVNVQLREFRLLRF